MSALGLPGLNSFAGEFLAFLGAFQSSMLFGALGTLVVIPAAWYMLRFFQGAMEGIAPLLRAARVRPPARRRWLTSVWASGSHCCRCSR